MSPTDKRKLILAGGIIAVVVMLLVGIYILVTNRVSQTSGTSAILTLKNPDGKVFSPAYHPDNTLEYYNEGFLQKYSFADNTTTALNKAMIPYLREAIFSPDGKQAILTILNGNIFNYSVINFATGKMTALPENALDADWLSNSEIIYSTASSTDNQTALYKTGADIIAPTEIGQLDVSDAIFVLSPDKKKLVIYTDPEGYGDNILSLYDLTTKTFSQFESRGLVGAIWSPDSQNIVTNLYNADASYKTLVINVITSKKTFLDNGYKLEKTIWLSNDNIIGFKSAAGVSDELRYINAKNGKSKKIKLDKDSQFFIDAKNLLRKDDHTVLFTHDDFLYQLNFQK